MTVVSESKCSYRCLRVNTLHFLSLWFLLFGFGFWSCPESWDWLCLSAATSPWALIFFFPLDKQTWACSMHVWEISKTRVVGNGVIYSGPDSPFPELAWNWRPLEMLEKIFTAGPFSGAGLLVQASWLTHDYGDYALLIQNSPVWELYLKTVGFPLFYQHASIRTTHRCKLLLNQT